MGMIDWPSAQRANSWPHLMAIRRLGDTNLQCNYNFVLAEERLRGNFTP